MTNQNISIQIHSDVEKFLRDCNDKILQKRIWECIEKIDRRQFDGGLRAKKLNGIGQNIWEARINRGSRLVYTYGRQYMIVQDICLDHDDVVRQARRARTKNDDIALLDRTDIEKIIGDLEQNYCSLDEEEKYNIEIAIEEDLNLPDDFLSSLDNTNYKVLETREQWEKAIIENSADLPYLLTLQEKELVEKTETLLISGSAGTGKTTIGLYRLLNWAKQRLNDEKEGKALYIAYNPVLVQEVKKQFERLIRLDEFKIDSQEIFDIIQFQTIEELCENRINNSNSEFLNDREKLNYNKFEKKYEEKTYHKKGYPAYFIWEEIRGVIKGSHLETESPLLSLEDYKNKGKNRSHVISCEERPEIHNLACWYQKTLSQEKDKKKTKKKDKKKRPIEYYDEIDLTREALKIIRDNKFKQYNLVICDEVQDFAEIQIRLLVEMSKKDSQLIFAGDLNQMISPSGFRWEDLTVNLYNLDFECEKLNNLTLNFRNIKSLANLSHQLLKLRDRFLDERDTLATIEGRNSGELTGLIKHPFSKISNILQEIKAGEGIIVKTEEQKKELQAAFNSKRIFTVEEAKGLEFDTVFLIDFFVEKQNLWDKKLNPKRQLKETEIPELALEFNLLYVAITRARRLLYICETSLSEVWQQPELSNFVKESDFAQVNLNRKNSTPEEWKEQGIVVLPNLSCKLKK
ncbi:UvrD-helicase domain-containing protein [Crocosphaera subtropica]|nr:UvrD-helicase domain-containing protein [Crocosphaera subtropica]